MTATVAVRPASPDEVETVAALWAEAGSWLADRGFDQWQYPPRQESIIRNIAANECWLVEDHDQVVATVTLDHHADAEFWSPADDPGAALYVHRMVVTRRSAGMNLGSALLDWAGRRATQEGKRWLRLDAWRTNTALQKYYAEQGFSLVRIVDLPHRGSGALFQRPSNVHLGRGPEIKEAGGTARRREAGA